MHVKPFLALLFVLSFACSAAPPKKTAHAKQALMPKQREAKLDSERITHGIQAYWDRKNKLQNLDNAKLQLKNDKLRFDTARLQGNPISDAQIKKDIAIVRNDEMAIKLSNDDGALEPHQAELEIEKHNRKYPFDKIAPISDINKEMDDFQSKINAIIEDSNKKLQPQKK